MSVLIVSIFPENLKATRPYSPKLGEGTHTYELPAPEAGKYSQLLIEDAHEMVFMGEEVGRRPTTVLAEVIGGCLVNEWATTRIGVDTAKGPGVFVATSPSGPTKEELASAKTRQTNWYGYLFDQAERLHRSGGGSQITDEMRRAAKWLGREGAVWLKPYEVIELKDCPFCFDRIPARATVCKTCRKELSPEPAKKG